MALDAFPPTLIDFPLRGEWVAVNTPARRVPSHGTDYFGQRYAFDFVQMDPREARFYPHSLFRHLLVGLPAQAFYCWDQPVYSAFPGNVIATGDGWNDRGYVHALWELLRATLIAPWRSVPRDSDYRRLAGNFVLIEGSPGVALYAHLRANSLRVTRGTEVTNQTLLGSVGNSGNSTMPHLHFHLMDGPDPYRAAGRPCAFRTLERFVEGRWVPLEAAVPGYLERIRAV